MKRLEYETGKLAIRYREMFERNPRFNFEQAMTNLIESFMEKTKELEQMEKDNLTTQELKTLSDEMDLESIF